MNKQPNLQTQFVNGPLTYHECAVCTTLHWQQPRGITTQDVDKGYGAASNALNALSRIRMQFSKAKGS